MTPEPKWVDLELPSGLLWAQTNIGTDVIWGYGKYFSWGNTDGHAGGSGYNFSQEVYNTTPGAAVSEDLSLEHDAARANLGAPWRMPTADEFQELIDNCTSVWTSLNGVNGIEFTSNVNGNKIFFPAAGDYNGTVNNYLGLRGFYWSSSYNGSTFARLLSFDDSEVDPRDNSNRYFGFSVRAVLEA